jgi:hypothetical protein
VSTRWQNVERAFADEQFIRVFFNRQRGRLQFPIVIVLELILELDSKPCRMLDPKVIEAYLGEEPA